MTRSKLKHIIFIGLIVAVVAGCSPNSATPPVPTSAPKPVPTSIPTIAPTAQSTAAAYSDAFAYCSAVGTLDQVDARYTGPKVPDNVIAGLRKALNSPSDMPNDLLVNGTFWRCMAGHVYACFVGANLPCDSKANTDKTPTQAEVDYCKQNPNSDFIPAVVTGHETIYNWKCNKDIPEAGQSAIQIDAQGYQSNIWYQIQAP
jgi:hypothetical protein